MRGIVEGLEGLAAVVGGFCAAWWLPPLVAFAGAMAVVLLGFAALLLPTREDRGACGPW